ncbi:MAG: DUF4058 family protein [Pirellulaceae bacterium]|nr:DUF4058 family protein [Pirellulaceae bacterium]
MPLRDHFRPPVSRRASWEGFHAGWPATIVLRALSQLPEQFSAEPRVYWGIKFDPLVNAYESDDPRPNADQNMGNSGGLATAVWSPPEPTIAVDADPTEQYAYEVLVYDQSRGRVLVAAVELVSPGNKDRPQSRREFVTKCAALLEQNVCVSIVDLVTTRHFNLYADLLDLIGVADPKLGSPPPATYAATCRGRKVGSRPRFESWAYPLIVGEPLPTLPLWLTEDFAISLDLEASYEDTCRPLRIC